jgi:hypothetical protein
LELLSELGPDTGFLSLDPLPDLTAPPPSSDSALDSVINNDDESPLEDRAGAGKVGLFSSRDERRLLMLWRLEKLELWCTDGGLDEDLDGVGRAADRMFVKDVTFVLRLSVEGVLVPRRVPRGSLMKSLTTVREDLLADLPTAISSSFSLIGSLARS